MSLHLRKSPEIDTCLKSDVLNVALHHAGYIGHPEGLLPKKQEKNQKFQYTKVSYASKLCK